MRQRRRHIRTRLTLWYVAVLTAILLLYGVSTLAFLYVSLRGELDRGLRADYERIEDRLEPAADGMLRLGGHTEDSEETGLVEVWSPEGTLLYRSAALGSSRLGDPAPAASKQASFGSLSRPGAEPLRVMAEAHDVAGRTVVIRVARSEKRLWHEWRELLAGLLLGLPVALGIAGLAGYWLVRRTLEPIEEMTRRAERMTADNLSERLPVDNPEDELGHLARVFNAAFGRIESSFSELRRFTADASHELRTPLTALRAVGEVVLQDPRDASRYREAISSMLEEVQRLSSLVDSLLVLSRAEAGSDPIVRTEHGLLESVRQSAALLAVLAEEKGQRISVSGDDSVRVDADAVVLRRAFVNLIDNAIKYSPKGGAIAIEVALRDGRGVVEVFDQGPGISRGHQANVFDHFYRVDAGRSREEGGAGLGLAIARRAVEVHGGRIELQSEEGKGSIFRIVLPARLGRSGAEEKRT